MRLVLFTQSNIFNFTVGIIEVGLGCISMSLMDCLPKCMFTIVGVNRSVINQKAFDEMGQENRAPGVPHTADTQNMDQGQGQIPLPYHFLTFW